MYKHFFNHPLNITQMSKMLIFYRVKQEIKLKKPQGCNIPSDLDVGQKGWHNYGNNVCKTYKQLYNPIQDQQNST